MGCGNKTLKTTGYKIDNQQGLSAQHRGLCSIFCNSLNGEKIWERMDTCITESLCCMPESNTTLFINYVCVLSRFSRVQLCKPVDHSPPGSSVRGILQARTLEWVAISSCRGSSWPRDQTHISFISCTGRWVLYPPGKTKSIILLQYKIKIKMKEEISHRFVLYSTGKFRHCFVKTLRGV